MKQLYMHQHASEAISKAIFIAGNGRSGTTILGKILHSFQNIEYAFEPPFLFSLLPLIDSMTQVPFQCLFETYCYEDLLLGQITGRALNMNSNDDSYIYAAKAKEEIAKRLQKSWSKKDCVSASTSSRLVIKMPDMARPLHKLTEYYPGLTVVATHRRANPVIESILKKKWFSDDNLNDHVLIWPSQNKTGLTAPSWLEPSMLDNWNKWSEPERAAYYYIRITSGLNELKNKIVFSYEKMIESPVTYISALAEKLNLEFGPMTKELLKSVEVRSSTSEDWVSKLPENLRQKILELESI